MLVHSFAKYRSLTSITLGAVLAIASVATTQAETLKAESGNPATFNSQLATLMSTYAERDHGIQMQLSTGQNLAMAGVKVGAGRIDLSMIPTELTGYMSEGSRMYASMGDQASAAADNLRSLFGYVHGAYHVFTWADSGIEDWDDLAGKNVYIGPASSAASSAIERIIEANTGMTPGNGYNGVTMGWGASGQAFSDGQVDVLVSGSQIGSSSIEQYSLVNPIRFLGIAPSARSGDVWQGLMNTEGMMELSIDNTTYPNVSNPDGDIAMLAFTMMSVVHQDMDDDTAYALTSTLWDNIDEIRASGPVFANLTIESAFTGVNVPLHPGAYRYYQEQGINVPARLVP